MKKKGFTLIELLAVIVILAIIVLIAVPIVLNVIGTAKNGAAKSSALGYIDAIEKQAMLYKVNNQISIEPNVYNYDELKNLGVNHKGKIDDAIINLDSKSRVKEAIISVDNYYICYVEGKVTSFEKKDVMPECGSISDKSGPDINITKEINMHNVKFEISVNDISGVINKTFKFGLDENDLEVIDFDNTIIIDELLGETDYYYELCASDKLNNENCEKGVVTTKKDYEYWYYRGDSMEDITGGYTITSYYPSSSDTVSGLTPSVTWGSDYVTISTNVYGSNNYKGGTLFANNQIDLSKYNKIQVYATTQSIGNGALLFRCPKEKITKYDGGNRTVTITRYTSGVLQENGTYLYESKIDNNDTCWFAINLQSSYNNQTTTTNTFRIYEIKLFLKD